MKSIFDPDFEYTPSVETDIRATFERVWRELDIRNQSVRISGERCSSVCLECNGELFDSCSVKKRLLVQPQRLVGAHLKRWPMFVAATI